MFTRTIEVNLKPETKPDFFSRFKAEVLPILKKTPGFFDIVVLENETEINKIFTISFWETKENIEYYEKERYPKVKAIVETFFATPPVVKYYTPKDTFSEKLFTTKSEPTRDRIDKSRLSPVIKSRLWPPVISAFLAFVFCQTAPWWCPPRDLRQTDAEELLHEYTEYANKGNYAGVKALYEDYDHCGSCQQDWSNLQAHRSEKITWVTRDFSEEKKSVKAEITFDSGTNYEPTYFLIKKGVLPCCYATKIREVQP